MPDKLDRLVFYHPQGWTLFQPNSAIYCIISSGLTLCLLDPFAASIRPLPQRLNSVFEPSCCIVSYHHDIIKTMISFKLIFLDRPCLYSTAPLKESVSLFTAASNESFNSIQYPRLLEFLISTLEIVTNSGTIVYSPPRSIL